MAYPFGCPKLQTVFEVMQSNGVIIRTAPKMKFPWRDGTIKPVAVWYRRDAQVGMGRFHDMSRETRVPWDVVESWATAFGIGPEPFGIPSWPPIP